jgi:predicted ATP-grasp superfamily ATP-dependent carboligase
MNLYWIGPRLSDLLRIDHLFTGAITIFGDRQNSLKYSRSFCNLTQKRINHNNLSNKEIDDFIIKELSSIVKKDKQANFLWYRGCAISQCSEDIISRSICQNSSLLINFLSDKLRTRLLIADYIPVLSSTLKLTKECSIANLKKLFPNDNEFVLQEPLSSSGGNGTHLLTKSNETKVIGNILSSDCLISPYYQNSVSINQHIVIYKKDIILFSPSIQIIRLINNKLQYCGGDYKAIDDLPNEIKEKIFRNSLIIGRLVQKLEYCGVLGIDYLLIKNEDLLFLELNCRFQASTLALNQALLDNNLPSIQEYHINSFGHDKPIINPNIRTPDYSIVSYINNRDSSILNSLKTLIESEHNDIEDIKVLNDGLDLTQNIEHNAYLFRLLFKTNIISLNSDYGVYHHPNIFLQKRKIHYFLDKKNLAYLKFSLLTHGIRFGKSLDNIPTELKLKEAVGKAFDLIIDNYLYINTPVSSKFSNLSPFRVEWIGNNDFNLFYFDDLLTSLKIAYQDTLSERYTSNGVSFFDVAQFFTDRLRIHPFPNCCYGRHFKDACKFCDLGNCKSQKKYNLKDIFEVIKAYINSSLPVKHFLIGGGSSLNDKRWDYICSIVKFIRSQTSSNIYLMTTPPKNIETLKKLKDSGVSEIGFNLEFYNRQTAINLMPGKGKISLDQYENAFKNATQLWGKDGNVRSILIVGLEPIKDTLTGVKFLSNLGVMPILSSFRPIPNTPMEDFIIPDFKVLYYVWKKSLEICKKNNLFPGPKCIPCQNNTISLPEVFL